MRSNALPCYLLFLIILFVVFASNSPVSASTSSTLLKAVKAGARSPGAAKKSAIQAASRVTGKVVSKATTHGLSSSSAAATATAGRAFARRPPLAFRVQHAAAAITPGANVLPFLKRSSSPTGFRSFSQRATRLQAQLQRSFSLRAILGDVITNHPGKQSSSAITDAAREDALATATAAGDLELQSLMQVRPRPPLFQDLQRIAAGTISESWSGFVGGYALGVSTGICGRVHSCIKGLMGSQSATATASAGHVLPYPSLLRHSQQSLQLHSRSVQFGVEWAQMSAVFAACRLLVQTVRQEEDEWNTVAGSTLAGAVFAASFGNCKVHLPPAAMARGALLYGGTMFLLHPHLWKQGCRAAMLMPSNDVNGVSFWDGME